MKPLRITDGIVPVGAFKAHASQLIRRVKAEHRPIVITQNGRPAAVLVSPEEFDRLNARERFASAVEEGLADSRAGRVTADEDLDAELNAAFGAKG
ncbi:MAG: type II toxin-antitoxin system Phd/YefM family antitoxin [Deferrisomatales bacterium]|nr:type II toxin-antitoxin system Phd/YefM family antitoxin [Deferrisomatales bacterium]